jgi:putative heme-binding domain-containing protein
MSAIRGSGHRIRAVLSVVCCVVVAVLPARASSPESDPQAERKSFEVAPGFEVSLFAADPAIAKPIQINFDAHGRLWIASSQSYPQLEPGAEPSDKIYVLDDSDGDGRADKTVVFAEGLLIPTGIEVGNGGAYVGHSTEVLFLKDTDRDGRADQTRVLLSGFGTEDTHHLVHTFRWSPGGWLHFAQSVYIHSHVETPWGVHRLNGGGFWRCRPDSLKLDVLVYGMVNSWGIAFDDYGQAFGVDNDHEESSIKYFLPGAKLRHTPDETHLLTGIVQRKPKYCGAEFVSGRHFPADWQGDFVTCDFRAHRVCRFKITDSGSGYAAQELEPLLATGSTAFRPVDVKMGPDGALYICDWHNPIINHGEVDFRDPRRDRTRGRIWRVTARNRPLAPRPNLVNASIDELLEAQTAPEEWTRHFARRTLAEKVKPAAVRPRLEEWTNRQSDELVRLRALWIYQTLDEPNRDLLVSLLRAKDGRVRAAAVRVLADWRDRINDARTLLAQCVADEHPRVRLEAVRALASDEDPTAMAVALGALDHPLDYWLEYALRLTARETAQRWLPGLSAKIRIGIMPGEAQRWLFALLALRTPNAAAPLAALWERGLVRQDDVPQVLDAIARFGNPEQLQTVLAHAQRAGQSKPDAPTVIRVLEALAEAHRLRGIRPAGDLAAPLLQFVRHEDAKIQEQAIRLAGKWRVDALFPEVWGRVKSSTFAPAVRLVALDALGDYGGERALTQLAVLATSTELGIRNHAIGVLVRLDSPRAAQLTRPILTRAASAQEVTALFEAFVRQRSGPQELAKCLDGVRLAQPVAQEGVRIAQASGHAAPELLAALVKAGSLPETARQLSPEQTAQLMTDVKSHGRPDEGEKIYRREKLGCVKCHAIKGAGGSVGPDLTTIGASAPLDYIIESLVAPNAKVKENFHSVVVATAGGQVVTGIPASKSADELVLRDAENRVISIPVKDIEETRTAGSLMPADVMDSLTAAELVHLVRFLSELGTPGPYGPNRELTARQWYLLGPVAADDAESMRQSLIAAGPNAREAVTGWQPSLTTNAGWVYLGEYALNRKLTVLFAVCPIDVKRAGKVRLLLEPAEGATCWLDGKPIRPVRVVGADAHFDLELVAGARHLLVGVNLERARSFLKLRGFPLDAAASFEFTQPPQ